MFGQTTSQHLAGAFWSLPRCPKVLGVVVIWDHWKTSLGWDLAGIQLVIPLNGYPLEISER